MEWNDGSIEKVLNYSSGFLFQMREENVEKVLQASQGECTCLATYQLNLNIMHNLGFRKNIIIKDSERCCKGVDRKHDQMKCGFIKSRKC